MATMQFTPTELSISDEIPECLCGQPGCLGHERVPIDPSDPDGNGKVFVPGFTSREELEACQNEVVVFSEQFKPHVLEAVRKSLSGA